VSRTEGRFNERRTGNRVTRRFEICLIPKAKDRERKDPVLKSMRSAFTMKRSRARTKDFLDFGVARDISDSRRAEEQLGKTCRELQETQDMLLQSEKLAAIGRPDGGVAHAILNPVNILSMRLQMLKVSEHLNEEMTDALGICENQVKRITKILGTLSQFLKGRPRKRQRSIISMRCPTRIDLYAPKSKKRIFRFRRPMTRLCL